MRNTVNLREEVVVPKRLLPVLADIGWPLRVETMLEWLTENRDRRAEFIKTAKKLDASGLKSLRHFIKHNLNVTNGKDPLYGAKRSLEIQKYKKRVRVLREKVSTGKFAFKLANGLTCLDVHPVYACLRPTDGPDKTIAYDVSIPCENSKVQMRVNVRNMMRLYENATKNASQIKRLHPWHMSCEVDGKNHPIADDKIRMVLRALADGIPPPIAVLVT